MHGAPASAALGDQDALYVAGIGASAGGVEAMLALFSHIRPTGRMACVVAQHMGGNGQDELVVRLLQRETTLHVSLAHDGITLQADTVYVIPSGKHGMLQGITLSLHEPGPGDLSVPSVNNLFGSIAETATDRAIGVVLSGTGSDGTAGCRAIQARGGLTLAQSPADARFDGMPAAAIEAGAIDQVQSATAIGHALSSLFSAMIDEEVAPIAPTAAPPCYPSDHLASDEPVTAAEQADLRQLLQQVRAATGIDFSEYKEGTLLRRLKKRQSVLGITSTGAYLTHIQRQPHELHHLMQMFLVSVSSFFRDQASFAALQDALALMLASKVGHAPIRVWVPGCASGEEAYTLALILHELLQATQRTDPIRITATDLNPTALAIARAGLYRPAALADMPAELRTRHFVAHNDLLQVTSALRDCVEFEQRDVFSGPPTDGLDLVSCRNLLIYMKTDLQDRLVQNFHQALRPNGLLFIGQSESLSFLGSRLFASIDHYHRLFRRRP